MRSKKFRRLVWLGGVYDYTNTKIKGYAPYKGFPKFHGLRYMIGTEDVLSNQYKQAKFQLTNVGFHVSYYADIPVYTWDYDEERDEFEDRFDEHSFSTIKKIKVDLKKQLIDSFVNNLEKNKKDIYEESEVTVLINNYKFEYKCNLNSIKEFEINKDSTRDEVIAFGKKYNLLEDFIRTWII
tara:strand:- start:1865 stop:2410 length:546 start_codon:yes stop_codon:yes gene_type:complete